MFYPDSLKLNILSYNYANGIALDLQLRVLQTHNPEYLLIDIFTEMRPLQIVFVYGQKGKEQAYPLLLYKLNRLDPNETAQSRGGGWVVIKMLRQHPKSNIIYARFLATE